MQELRVSITSITVLVRQNRADIVSLHTCLPPPYPGLSQEPLWLEFDVAQGDGYRYVTEELGIKPELIEVIRTQ